MALRSAPGVFTSTYERERTFPARRWQQTIAGHDHQVFGLFDGDELIGITAVFTHRDDPRGETALLAMSFILPDYRAKGLSRLLYQARLDWIAARPAFKRVVVSHRASNKASQRANQRFGFVEVGRTPHLWPEGATEDEVSCELTLEGDSYPRASNAPTSRAELKAASSS